MEGEIYEVDGDKISVEIASTAEVTVALGSTNQMQAEELLQQAQRTLRFVPWSAITLDLLQDQHSGGKSCYQLSMPVEALKGNSIGMLFTDVLM